MNPSHRKVPPVEKIALATGALIGWLGVALQFYVLMQNHAGISTTEAVLRFFSFFTILTSLFVAADIHPRSSRPLPHMDDTSQAHPREAAPPCISWLSALCTR